MSFFVPRIQPGSAPAWLNPPRVRLSHSQLDWSPERRASDNRAVDDASLLLSAGLPAATLQQIGSLALRWDVPLREVALTTGGVQPAAYIAELVARCDLNDPAAQTSIRLRTLYPPPPPHRHLSAPLLMLLDAPRGGVALNAELLSLAAARELTASLGPAREGLVLMSRRALTNAIAEAYGPSLASEAENRFANAEDLTEDELEQLHQELQSRAQTTLGALDRRRAEQAKKAS